MGTPYKAPTSLSYYEINLRHWLTGTKLSTNHELVQFPVKIYSGSPFLLSFHRWEPF